MSHGPPLDPHQGLLLIHEVKKLSEAAERQADESHRLLQATQEAARQQQQQTAAAAASLVHEQRRAADAAASLARQQREAAAAVERASRIRHRIWQHHQRLSAQTSEISRLKAAYAWQWWVDVHQIFPAALPDLETKNLWVHNQEAARTTLAAVPAHTDPMVLELVYGAVLSDQELLVPAQQLTSLVQAEALWPRLAPLLSWQPRPGSALTKLGQVFSLLPTAFFRLFSILIALMVILGPACWLLGLLWSADEQMAQVFFLLMASLTVLGMVAIAVRIGWEFLRTLRDILRHGPWQGAAGLLVTSFVDSSAQGGTAVSARRRLWDHPLGEIRADNRHRIAELLPLFPHFAGGEGLPAPHEVGLLASTLSTAQAIYPHIEALSLAEAQARLRSLASAGR